MADKDTVVAAANTVAALADLPFYSELIDALRLAKTALEQSEPKTPHYPEPVARHKKALGEVRSCLVRFDQGAA
jgi:hypothetical protein